ncbi:Outer membrane protein TolC [Mesorhizobium sp. YR577]|nr:Outer membrane protein TolC [Mesorhizobium sp. YR577]
MALSAGLLATGCALKMEPLSEDQNLAFASERLIRATANQEPVSGSISLYEAMARALKYNLDTKVEIMEAALKVRELDLANYSALPKLVVNSGYAGRTDPDSSTPSTRDPDIFTDDLTFSWNILDFGLSYVRAKQTADEALIQEEMKRKIVNRVIEDVRTAYWRAVSYERLVGRMRALEGRVAGALRDTRRLASSGESSPLVALTYERELIQVQREIELLEGELKVSKSQLAALMNVTPGSNYTLAVPKRRTTKLGLPGKSGDLFQIAVTNRPEMREVAYRMRINEKEVDAALLELLPSFNLYAGVNYDSNKFISSNDWVSWGAKVSWNLMKLATMPAVMKKVEAQQAALDARSLSVAMAIMTQVHISRVRYAHLQKSYGTAAALSNVSHRILTQVRAETAAQRTSEQVLIREEMNALLADAKLDMAYADLQNAYANVYASLGLNPFPTNLSTDESVAVIAEKLKGMWIERGTKAGTEVAGLQ